MSGNKEEKKTYYRLAPCPAYDVEGMESWLQDMAEQGLFLTGDGFFCGFGFFYMDEPRSAKYRLQTSEVQGGFLSDGDEPEQEQQEISEALGWEFVARRGEFYIYRSMREDVRELNTDPEIQAITMKMVQKRQLNSLFNTMLWMILFPIIRGSKTALIVPVFYMRTWFFLFTLFLVLWLFIDSIKKLVYYTKLRRKLKHGEQPDRKKNWKKHAWRYPVKIVAAVVLCCIWIFIVLGNIHRTVLFEDEIPLAEYAGNPPFATMTDIAPGNPCEIEPMSYCNTVVEWSDVLAPVNFIWEEIATVQVTEEQSVYGLWEVKYHEVKWQWMATLLAKDYLRMDKEGDFQLIGELDLGVDYAVAYIDNIHMKNVILVHGNKVLQGTFHEYSGEKENYFTMEEWAKIMADSIK